MDNLVSLICPNCGAATTNHKNCEYCNSLLVRFVDKEIEIDQSRYGKGAWTFPGLEDVLEILKIKAKTIDEDVAFVFEIDDNRYLATTGIYFKNNKFEIELHFGQDDKQSHGAFKKNELFPLFTHSKSSNLDFDEYKLEYGLDISGAAKIITQLLIEVHGVIPQTDVVEYQLWGAGGIEETYRGGKTEPFHKVKDQVIPISQVKSDDDDERKTNIYAWIVGIVIAAAVFLFTFVEC